MTARLVDLATIPDGARVEHTEWADGFWPQLGTVVRIHGTRAVAWDGTTATNPLTEQLATKLVRIA